MMYILTEAEYDKLIKKRKAQRRLNWLTKQQLQTLCTKIADTMPADWGWGGDEPKPWGCIITAETESGGEWYCDQCPVHSICEYDEKRHSK